MPRIAVAIVDMQFRFVVRNGVAICTRAPDERGRRTRGIWNRHTKLASMLRPACRVPASAMAAPKLRST